MPKDPIIDNASFFSMIDPLAGSLRRATQGTFPWENIAEDRFAAEEQVRAIYAKAGFKAPRIAWALSPRSLHGAQSMLREINMKSKHAMITSLVPMSGDRVEAEIRRTLLNAILDPNLTTTTGADLTTATNWNLFLKWHSYRNMLPLTQLRSKVGGDEVYSALYSELIGPVAQQTLCIKPFMHICWMVRPPKFIKMDADGNLHCEDGPAVLFEDGFEVWARHKEEEEPEYLDMDDGSEALPKPNILQLPAPEESE